MREILSQTKKGEKDCGKAGCKICGEAGRPCSTKDVVYRATCNLCGDTYVGETGRALRSRVAEHIAAVRTGATEVSALAAHHRQSHHSVPGDLSFSVLRRGEGFVTRKCYEALRVKEDYPVLSRHCLGPGVVPV